MRRLAGMVYRDVVLQATLFNVNDTLSSLGSLFSQLLISPVSRQLIPATMSSIEQILSDPRYHDYLAILKGARNGLVYGAKVRFPHALIMAILFGRGE